MVLMQGFAPSRRHKKLKAMSQHRLKEKKKMKSSQQAKLKERKMVH